MTPHNLVLIDNYDTTEKVEFSVTENLDEACLLINPLNGVAVFINKRQAQALINYLTGFVTEPTAEDCWDGDDSRTE